MTEEPRYTIGKVVKRLQANHPDLTVSKVRFLEAEGLVTPQRTKSGYRMYSEHDIAVLEAVLQMQKTQFYPLAVIKEKLEASPDLFLHPAGSEDAGAANEGADAQATHADAFAQEFHPIDEMAERAGVPATFVGELIDAGFLNIKADSMGRPSVSGCDLELIKAAFELGGLGFDTRTLKSHIQRAMRVVTFYKLGLANAARKDPDAQEQVEKTLDHLIDLNNAIYATLVRRMAKL